MKFASTEQVPPETIMPRFALRFVVLLSILPGLKIPTSRAEERSAPSAPQFVREWGKKGTAPGEFDFPIGIVADRTGEILVSDFYNSRIQRFNSEGKLLGTFAVLPNPGAITLDRHGDLYITHFPAMRAKEEKKPDRVTVYSPEGKLLRQWGSSGKGDGQFDYIGGIAVSPDDRVYVADQTNRRVEVFDIQGKFLLKWGEYGTKKGQFGGDSNPRSRVGGPQFIALDHSGNVYTTEASTLRIQKFSAEGKFLHAFSHKQDGPGGFGGTFLTTTMQGPIGICCDSQDRLWVTAVSGRIQQFTTDGKFLQSLGKGKGDGPGEFDVPHSMGIAPDGDLYVADSYNHRIQKFSAKSTAKPSP